MYHFCVLSPRTDLCCACTQLSRLRSDKKYINVGMVGYPNVGKSSVINTLRTKKVSCLPAAAMPKVLSQKCKAPARLQRFAG